MSRHDNTVNKLVPLSGPVAMSDFRRRLAEMLDRVEDGEEVVIARGNDPVAKLTQLDRPRGRRLGILRDVLSKEECDALVVAIEEPLPEEEQRILEGEGTDALGIWHGLPEARS